MADSGSDAPVWLFSFVDLAFLLLIAMTQVGGEPGKEIIDLGEIVVPRIGAAATTDLPSAPDVRWQLRVHPAEDELPPFELSLPSAPAEEPDAARISADELRTRVAVLVAEDAKKPLLAPHADSRSQDLLDAAGILEEHWPSRRRATVAPIFAGR